MRMENPQLQEEFEGDDELARQILSLRQQPSAELQRRVQSIPQQKARWTFSFPRLTQAALAVLVIVWLFSALAVLAPLNQVQDAVGRIVMNVLPTKGPLAVARVDKPAPSEGTQLAVSFDLLPTHLVPDESIVSGSEEAVILTDLDGVEEAFLYDSQMASFAESQPEQDALLLWKANMIWYMEHR